MPQATEFVFDVFLSHSAKDKEVVRDIAERLRRDGLRVWFDEWQLKSGGPTAERIERGLERSRVLVLCISANVFGPDWAQLEAGTFRFRDPLNKNRRFISLRLDETPTKGSIAQYLYLDWPPDGGEQTYAKLLDACRPTIAHAEAVQGQAAESAVQLRYRKVDIRAFDFSANGMRALSGGDDKSHSSIGPEDGTHPAPVQRSH